MQAAIGWLSPLIIGAPEEAHKILEMLTSWGISRFSIKWDEDPVRELTDQLAGWGYEVNIYKVPDLGGIPRGGIAPAGFRHLRLQLPAMGSLRSRFW